MARTIPALINNREYHIAFGDDEEVQNYISASFAQEIQDSNIEINRNGFFFMTLDLGFEDDQDRFGEIETSFLIKPDFECQYPIFLGSDFLDAEEIHSVSEFSLIIESEDRDLMQIHMNY